MKATLQKDWDREKWAGERKSYFKNPTKIIIWMTGEAGIKWVKEYHSNTTYLLEVKRSEIYKVIFFSGIRDTGLQLFTLAWWSRDTKCSPSEVTQEEWEDICNLGKLQPQPKTLHRIVRFLSPINMCFPWLAYSSRFLKCTAQDFRWILPFYLFIYLFKKAKLSLIELN